MPEAPGLRGTEAAAAIEPPRRRSPSAARRRRRRNNLEERRTRAARVRYLGFILPLREVRFNSQRRLISPRRGEEAEAAFEVKVVKDVIARRERRRGRGAVSRARRGERKRGRGEGPASGERETAALAEAATTTRMSTTNRTRFREENRRLSAPSRLTCSSTRYRR